jgi:hypothetical protein
MDLSTIEFEPWKAIPLSRRRVVAGQREVLGVTFTGRPAWLP